MTEIVARHEAMVRFHDKRGGMPWSDNLWRDPALVTCEQVDNPSYPEK
jgi:hypothetical protein